MDDVKTSRVTAFISGLGQGLGIVEAFVAAGRDPNGNRARDQVL